MPTVMTDFVPAELDATRWDRIEPLLKALLARPVDSAEALERWLVDRSELEAACAEAESILHINMTCHTEDQAAQEAWTTYIETIPPKLKPLAFELDKRQHELSARFRLGERSSGRYQVLIRDTAAEVELFRPENVPIQTQLAKLDQKHQQITGAMTVQFDGQEKTLPQMGRYQEVTDRAVREAAWRAVSERRLRDAEPLDAIFDEMVTLRHRMARNAGFENFTGYAFKMKRRFDYAPKDCFRFHEAVEKVVVPFRRRLDEKRRSQLKLSGPLRPWDLAVDPKGRPALRPFDGGKELVARTSRALERLDPELAKMFATLGDGSNSNGAAGGACLDLDSRKGKAPGGYQSMRDRSRTPFIFMNAAGLHRDVETMVHEAGHAFHSMLCIDEPLLHYRHAPLEFCEVASMSMELLTMPYWGLPDTYYPSKEDADRARRKQIEGSVGVLPWIATIDAFQHWIYGNPSHARDERTRQWLALDDRFGQLVSWEGLAPFREKTWQRQLHLFSVPFYYIEYGIAQLGALQLWVKSLEAGEKAAITEYKKGLALGGSRPLPELFAGAGLRFDFGPDTVARLLDRVERELEKLPE